MSRLDRCFNIDDLRRLAQRRAHRMAFDYMDGGSDDEVTLRRNSEAFAKFDLDFKVLTGVESVDTSTTLLGKPISVPYFCSPVAGNRLFHTEGEGAVARAFAEQGTIYSLSTLSSLSIEDVAAVCPGRKWFQLYVWKDRSLVKEMLKRAKRAGYEAIILTVDFPITGNRERDPRNGFTIPPNYGPRQSWAALKAPRWTLDYLLGPPVKYANLTDDTPAISLSDFVADQFHPGFTWTDAEWLLSEWNGPAVIKGVVRTDDARRAADLGFHAVMVSNHGGRQLDFSPAPIDVLEPIVQELSGDAEVILDGGVRRGTDILKALSFGAQAVSFGRPYLYGLAAGGYAGVQKALQLMRGSIERDMALAGVQSIEQIDRSMIRKRW